MEILIIDDLYSRIYSMEWFIQETLKALNCTDYQIWPRRCDTAQEAINAISFIQPGIVFLDYSLTENETCYAVAQWIDQNYPDIKVATHTVREEEQARRLFAGTKCVTHFLGYDTKKNTENFLKYCLNSQPA